MNLVLVESPYMYKSDNPLERAVGLLRNLVYARLALRDCFHKGEAPYCSHLLYTQPLILNDDIASERQIGIDAGLDWGSHAQKTAVYTDLGLSAGMNFGLANAKQSGRPIEYRCIEGWKSALSENPRETLLRLGLYEQSALDTLDMHSVFGPGPLDNGFGSPGMAP